MAGEGADQARVAEVLVVPVPGLLACLQQLEQHHQAAGRVSHARGVRSAIAMVQREARDRRRLHARAIPPDGTSVQARPTLGPAGTTGQAAGPPTNVPNRP